LAAVLLVPVTVAVGAGLLQIQGYVTRADSYAAMGRLVSVRSAMGPLITGIQQERAFAAQRAEGAGVELVPFREHLRITGEAATNLRDLVARTTTFGEVAAARYKDVVVQLDGLPQLRERVLSGSVDLAGGVGGYSVVLHALLDFDQALVGEFGDSALAGTGTALHNLAMAGEQMSWQHAAVLAAVSRGELVEVESTMIEQSWTRLQDKLADFAAVATPDQQNDYRLTVAGPDVDSRNRLMQVARDEVKFERTTGASQIAQTVPVDDWNKASAGASKLIDQVLHGLEGELSATAARLQDETSDKAGIAAVILLASLIAAAAVGIVVGSYLLRSLRTLRTTVLDVAAHKLPELVADLREDAARPAVIEPVDVRTTEELGQLARAFDAVHQQAVRSAVEEANLRSGLRNTFVNLSRRSQGLVERQLRLMEELERQEENPQQLANLFKLDHLATRMRRNNENLMVLSGSDVTRRFTRPVPLADVLRAGASEIEQYQRVIVQAAPQVEIVGYAASDLVRLVAELLDNATAFSPPRSQVLIGGRPRPGGGVLIDVVDQGVGMAEEELAEANGRLLAVDSEDLPASRQMGLFVVARLAGRHGVEVKLVDQGPDRDGLRAVVGVPTELVRVPKEDPRATPARPAPAEPEPAASAEWSSFRGKSIVEPPKPVRRKSTWFTGPITGEPARHRAADPTPASTAPAEPPPAVPAPAASDAVSAELPKRRPRGNLAVELSDVPEHAPVRRDPQATRGFLANYQTGIRQGVRDSGDQRAGQENP
jgi:signal transduction histidine kinase